MTRAQRLPHLLKLLQRTAAPMTCAQFACHFGERTRTFNADIECLRRQGHVIETTADGFLLQPPAPLSPAIFTEEELEAIVSGLCWLSGEEGSPLSEIAGSAIAKIEALLPPPAEATSEPFLPDDASPMDIIQAAIAGELKLHIDYRDAKGRTSARIVWPLDFEEYDDNGMIEAWCEYRSDFRNFRLDRIQSLHLLERYPIRRATLLARSQLASRESF